MQVAHDSIHAHFVIIETEVYLDEDNEFSLTEHNNDIFLVLSLPLLPHITSRETGYLVLLCIYY